MASDEVRIVHHEDRLPWLETVEADDVAGPSFGRLVALVVLGLALIAAIVLAVYRVQHREAAADGQLIAAPEGDYKTRPDNPGGLKVEGEGTTAVATSAGKSGNGAIDLKAVPEAPIDGRRAQPQATDPIGGGRNAVSTVPASGGRLSAKPPVAADVAATGAAVTRGGSQVQLGAYPSEAVANASWTSFAKRFGYLSALGKSVQPVASGGKTLYRLRVDAGSANQAADICGRLKVAGESCFVAG